MQNQLLQITRQRVEGKVKIKRKTKWVDRYAQIRESIFQYKQDKYSMSARFITDLRKCVVRKGVLDKGTGYFEIRDKNDPKAEVILITYESDEEFK